MAVLQIEMDKSKELKLLDQLASQFNDNALAVLGNLGDPRDNPSAVAVINKIARETTWERLQATFDSESAVGKLARFLSGLCDAAQDPSRYVIHSAGLKRSFEDTQSVRSGLNTRSAGKSHDKGENDKEGASKVSIDAMSGGRIAISNNKCNNMRECKVRRLQRAPAVLQNEGNIRDVRARTELAIRLLNGRGIPKSVPRAVEHLKAAVRSQDRVAASWLAECYEKGMGVPRDVEEARSLYHMSASAGHRHAMFILAERYHRGWEDLKPNIQLALHWFQKAAERDCFSAQCRLGDIFRHGLGVTQDYFQSFRWYAMAEKNGCTRAVLSLADAYKHGYGVPANQNEALRLLAKYRTLERNRRYKY